MPVRFLALIVLTVAAVLVMFLLLVATDTALSVWARLQAAPLWLQVGYTLALVGAASAISWLAWRWLRPSKKTRASRAAPPETREALHEDIVVSAQSGVDVGEALEELREQERRKRSAAVYIALFGEVSTGKSSLVSALLPEAEVESDARAGTTTEVRHFEWTAESGDRVMIADLPGFNLDDDPAIEEEARRAHLVVFLCDGDMTRSQVAELVRLRKRDKPLVVALNKVDLYSPSEVTSIIRSLAERTGIPRRDIVQVQTGGREEIVRVLADGQEETLGRDRPVDIETLRLAIQRHLDGDRELMESLRDTAVVLLASEKLESARDRHRLARAETVVTTYSRRAVIGALAAVAPGSDIVIQGVLATKLIQELCAIYDVSPRDMEINEFLKLAGGKVRNMAAITMAIAGNALKAFPGMGTISGGLLHAVAYGMIFDSLGRAAAETLRTRGELRPYPAAEAFEDLMRENVQSGAVRFAKMAIRARKDESA